MTNPVTPGLHPRAERITQTRRWKRWGWIVEVLLVECAIGDAIWNGAVIALVVLLIGAFNLATRP